LPGSYPTTVPGLVIEYASLSDIGCRRQRNEDSVGFFQSEGETGTYLFVVADGVGGSAAGDVASKLAVDAVGERLFAAGDPPSLSVALQDAIQAANRAIYDRASDEPTLAGMATTCTAAAMRGLELYVGHVGDCRAYLATNGSLQQLTSDHSLAAEYEQRGQFLPAEKKALANVLTRWLGTELVIEIDVSEGLSLQEGSNLILCSDGLTKTVQPGEILKAVSEESPAQACQDLVDLAKKRGGPDNISLLVARIERG
jgi:serine/threonine protein phosphatase PrpC